MAMGIRVGTLLLMAACSLATAPPPLPGGRNSRPGPLAPAARTRPHTPPGPRPAEPLQPRAGARRLAQETTLGIAFKGAPQGVARQKNVADLGAAALQGTIQPQDGVTSLTLTDFANARTFFPGLLLLETTFGANDRYGGVTKSSSDLRSRTDQSGGSTQSTVDSRSISQPGLGRTSAAAGLGAATLSQKLLDPGQRPANNSAAPGPVNAVVLASQLATGVAGDYSLVTPDYQDTGTRDYDYGQDRPIPSTAMVDARTGTDVKDADGTHRAASFGKTKAEATAPAAATRTNNIASNYLVG
ncbi:hypothetical protein MNEG_4205 [Monoraphidium neglectum]|uniref:Uncharacterized protein n=1 Tax=Monoraphidium neglectum TaxID=145388 RepID=A0A0D2MTH6_9CHLO|nr:hypothetical protein MNEG_4205 [Monoraphidium neglectum]KIZ03757.1 hypothetical protein MNEG_4205 [Monoraphidium neglectum]|eukprot:XP_013902776.1 hypothetical protein MNEG_4205 [Monoraphidium neglectum]